MPKKNNGRNRLYEFCEELSPEDGLATQDIAKFLNPKNTKPDYHQMKLCRQVRDELEMIFHGEARDEFFWNLQILDVLPIPLSHALQVRLAVSLEDDWTQSEVQEELLKRKAWLKFEVAKAIHRKRMPELRFTLIIQEEER